MDDHPLRRRMKADPSITDLVKETFDIQIYRVDRAMFDSLLAGLSKLLGRRLGEEEGMTLVTRFSEGQIPTRARAQARKDARAGVPPTISQADAFRWMLGACFADLGGFFEHALRADRRRRKGA